MWVLVVAYADNKDPVEEVDKFVAAYHNTPHSTTGEKPSKLLFNHEVNTKLPRFPKVSAAKHHNEARRQDREKGERMKRQYNDKHRTRTV